MITKEQAIYNISIYLQTGGRTIPPGFKSSLKLALKLLAESTLSSPDEEEIRKQTREMALREVGEWLEKMLRFNGIRGAGLRSELGKLVLALKQGTMTKEGKD